MLRDYISLWLKHFAYMGVLSCGAILLASVPWLWSASLVCAVYMSLLAFYHTYQAHLLKQHLFLRKIHNHQKSEPKSDLWQSIDTFIRKYDKRRQEQIRQKDIQYQKFVQAIKSSPNGVMITNQMGEMLWFNPVCAHLLNLHGSDHGQRITNLLRQPEFQAFWQENLEQGEAFWGGNDEEILQNKPSIRLNIHNMAIHATQVKIDETRYLCIFQDITQAHTIEEMRKNFMADVSHELSTPLTVVRGYVESLRDLELPAAQQKTYLNKILQKCYDMQHLIQNLLLLAQLESKPQASTLPAVNLNDLLQEVYEKNIELGPKKQWAILLPKAPASYCIYAHKTHIEIALNNLIQNAIFYTPEHARITLGVQEVAVNGGKKLRIYVQDTGPGIDAEHVSRLTDRFYQTHQARYFEGRGSGLGLSIVAQIAKRYGIHLHIESTLGQGSCFALEFDEYTPRK